MFALRFHTTLLVLMVLVMCCCVVQCRYLPTRSDGTRMEQIKELLRAILELPQDEREVLGRANYPYEYHSGVSTVAKRSVREVNDPIVYQTGTE